MIPRSAPENSEYGRRPSRSATWVCTVPFQSGGPQVSSEAAAEIPRESDRPDSRASTPVMRTVSLSIEPARHPTRSVFELALSCQSRWSSERAVPSNRKARGMLFRKAGMVLFGLAPASAIAALKPTTQRSLATRTQEAAAEAGEIATPQGIFPAGIFLITFMLAASMTVTSLEGPLAV
jgi:hypothetical protein